MLNERLADPLLPSDVRHGWTEGQKVRAAGYFSSLAARLAGEGAQVLVNGRTEARVQAAAAQIKHWHSGATVRAVAADLGTAAGVARLVEVVKEVDILVNNLGIFEPIPFEKTGDETWLKFFEVNVLSGVRLSRQYLPMMLKKNWGRIIFISSESALQVPAEMIHYGMTKTAQIAVARGLAELTAGTAVTVNSVLAGPTRSEGVETFLADLAKAGKTDVSAIEKEFFKSVRPSSLLKRFETPEEVAALTTFLCSPLASGTNGAAVRAEGGVVKSAF